MDTSTQETLPDGHKSGFVAVVGRPNVGKSTLLNAMLKQKIAIVTPRPQTTRQKQLGIVTEDDYQIIFIDTPGIMKKAKHQLDEVMLEAAEETLKDGDVVLWLVDAGFPPDDEDRRLAELVGRAAGRVILVMNKNDLIPPDQVIERTDAYRELLPEDTQWFFIAAHQSRGVDELFQAILDALPEGPRYYPADQITDTFVRDIVAELIREQLLQQLREEIPHGTAVKVTDFKENEIPTHIRATIFVEREGHKRIVIGAGGSQLKKIGSAARQEIEDLMGEQVFLELWVKVAQNWRKQESQLKRFGYKE
ncbi:MAG: GTPase Era [Ardenticatenaceae bacterium]|nr:GTPase Era [Ardenticatenaceae bacterium]